MQEQRLKIKQLGQQMQNLATEGAAEFRTMGKKEFARRMTQAEEAIWK